tara:strand:+ start:144 stop:1280 length:1137 start_codon:yes stop_codon:yes gene_type:complete
MQRFGGALIDDLVSTTVLSALAECGRRSQSVTDGERRIDASAVRSFTQCWRRHLVAGAAPDDDDDAAAPPRAKKRRRSSDGSEEDGEDVEVAAMEQSAARKSSPSAMSLYPETMLGRGVDHAQLVHPDGWPRARIDVRDTTDPSQWRRSASSRAAFPDRALFEEAMRRVETLPRVRSSRDASAAADGSDGDSRRAAAEHPAAAPAPAPAAEDPQQRRRRRRPNQRGDAAGDGRNGPRATASAAQPPLPPRKGQLLGGSPEEEEEEEDDDDDDDDDEDAAIIEELAEEESELYSGSNTLIGFFSKVQRYNNNNKIATKGRFEHAVLSISKRELEQQLGSGRAAVSSSSSSSSGGGGGGGGSEQVHFIVDRCDAVLTQAF